MCIYVSYDDIKETFISKYLQYAVLIIMRHKHHYDDVKSPASRLFTQRFIQAQINEDMKAPRHWPLCVEFTGDRWIPRTNGQWRGKCFHLMTSSCGIVIKTSWDFTIIPYIISPCTNHISKVCRLIFRRRPIGINIVHVYWIEDKGYL